MKPLLEQIPALRTATASLPKTAAATVQIVDPLAVADWDALVMRLPGHSFFHSSAWARTLEESYGYKPLYFAKVENGELRGLLPMMEVNSWLTGKRGVSLPFSDMCEPLGQQSDIAELQKAVITEGRDRKWKRVEFRGQVGSAVPSGPLPPSESFYNHHLPLTSNEEKVFATFESSVRRAIRKAEKSGPTIDISVTLDGVKTFYALHCQTRKKHGVPPQPFSFFESFHRNIIAHNFGFVVIAKFQGQPIAASVFVHFGTRAIYKYGASDENFQNLRGANLVMWHAIQWYARAGYTEFGFGRTDMPNDGLRRFKLGWGAQEHALDYFKYDLRANQFVSGKGESSQRREKVVRHIPIPIARMIGSVLYRHVA